MPHAGLGREAASVETAQQGQAPNIVLIISDDQAWTDYGFMGHPHIETPALDHLAKQSAVFRRGYVPTALCRPSLATLMTGLYAHQHQISGNDPLRRPPTGEDSQEYHALRERLIAHIDRVPLLAKQLVERGYLAHQSGKWWEGSFQRGGFTHGMTRGFPQRGGRHGDDGLKIGREGMEPITEFIDFAVEQQKPFFVWYAPFLPHSPHNPPEHLFKKYKDKGIESDHVARYYAMVEWFDQTCGSLLEHLDARNQRDNTLIVYVGDNGWIQDPASPGFAPRSKQSANEGGTRQPTMFCWPGKIPPLDRGDQLCSSVDIVPTLQAAAGITSPIALPGFNLLECLLSGEPTPRQEVYGETFAHDIAELDDPQQSLIYRWIIQGPWKLLLTYNGEVGRYGHHHPRTNRQPQLYNLLDDPHEQHDLAAAQPQRVEQLSELIAAWWPVEKRLESASTSLARPRPNVLFLAIDDQNDWVGHLGGHPLAKTPHLDRLATQGTTFLNAHCQSPLCNPSRTSLMLSLRPTTTGIYGLSPWFRDVEAFQDRVTLPQHFKAHGYRTLTTGKIYHGGVGGPEARLAEFDVWGDAGGIGAKPDQKLIPPTPMGNHPLMDWGAFPHRDEDKGDYQVTSWTIDRLREQQPDQPFFLAAGFFLPHVPCYVTPRWLEAFPNNNSVLPEILEQDRADTPRFSWYLHWNLPEPRLRWVRDNDQWINLARSYLASSTFIDHQIGRILDELQRLNLTDNTIVVVWSDHGFHLGEKGITGKNTLWEDGTRVPLIFAGPGVTAGQRCTQPAELLDIYPTLVELCGLEQRQDLEGISLAPQLVDASAARRRPAITSHNQGNHAIRSHRWRYIHYADGTEELYDLDSDPHEWHNLAGAQDQRVVIEEHRQWLPKVDRPAVVGSAHRILTYDPQTDTAEWEGMTITRQDPIPE
jgi:choline-sulfatase